MIKKKSLFLCSLQAVPAAGVNSPPGRSVNAAFLLLRLTKGYCGRLGPLSNSTYSAWLDSILLGLVCFPLQLSTVSARWSESPMMSFVCNTNTTGRHAVWLPLDSVINHQGQKRTCWLACSQLPRCWGSFLWRSCFHDLSGDITSWPISGMHSVCATFPAE